MPSSSGVGKLFTVFLQETVVWGVLFKCEAFHINQHCCYFTTSGRLLNVFILNR